MDHNEEANVGRTIRAVLEQQGPLMRIEEVIVVNSGCTDHTVPIVAEIALQEPQVQFKPFTVSTVPKTLDSDEVSVRSAQSLHCLSCHTPIPPTRDNRAACDTLSLPVSRPQKRGIAEHLFQLVQQRLFGFGLVGLGVMLGGMALLYGLVHYHLVEEHIAYFIQAIACIEANFMLNRWVNWRDRKGAFLPQWIKFHTTKIGTIPFNLLLFALLISIGVHYLLATLIGVVVATIINYVSNDQFVFVAPKQQDSLIGSRAQQSTYLPPVGIVVALRNSQRTIRQCVQSLLAQDYQGAFTITLIGNTPDQDASWEGLGDLVNHPRIQCIQLQRPATWVGRDANMKRYYGSFFALQTGVEIIALIDSQVEVPANWLSTGIRILDAQQVDGVAGISCRHPQDRTLPGVYQDGSLFSEWPRYGVMSLLSRANFATAKRLPITANLLFSRNVFERIHDRWPLTCSYGWEDFHLAWEIVCGGATILCTDTLQVHRLHQRKFRLGKHFSAGIAALAFHQTHATNGYTTRLLLKACGVVACLIALIAAAIVLVSMHGITALSELGIALALALFPFSMLSVIKARDWRGIIFPLLDTLHIGLWIAGATYMLVQKGRISPDLANALMKSR